MSSPIVFLTDGRKGFLVLYDYVVSLLAVLLNLIVLRAVLNAKIHLKGYKYCLVSLGINNLYLACVNVAIFVIEAICFYDIDTGCWGQVFRSLQITGLIANLLNLFGMSIDHLIGIVFPYAYNRFTKDSVIKLCFLVLWLLASLIGSVELPLKAFAYLAKRHYATDDSSTSKMPLANRLKNANCILDMDSEEDLLASLKGDYDDDEEEADDPDRSTPDDDFTTDHLFLQLRKNVTGRTDPTPLEHGNLTSAESVCGINTVVDLLEHAKGTAFGDSRKICGHDRMSWCDYYRDVPFMEYIVVVLAILCFVLAAICYALIFKEIFFKPKAEKRNAKRLVCTTLLLLGTFAICYLPFIIFELSMALAIYVDHSAGQATRNSWQSFMVTHNVFSSLLITSPFIQPLSYAARLATVRRQILRDIIGSRSLLSRSADAAAEAAYWQPTVGGQATGIRTKEITQTQQNLLY